MRQKNKEESDCVGVMLRKPGKMSGFTMIEVVITIAVVAILAAILVPLVSQNITSARFARAASDVKTLGEAIIQFRRDTAVWPVYEGNQVRNLLFSDVDAGNDGTPDTGSLPEGAGWEDVTFDLRLSLGYHLIDYRINLYDSNILRGPSTSGTPSWNGPYLDAVRPDPWGTTYVVNCLGLGGTTNVYVVSAGPGRPANVETPFNGSGPPPAGSDDVVFRLQ